VKSSAYCSNPSNSVISISRQSPQGFLKAGGFKGVYRGLGAAALGSSPGAALFFCTYDTLKANLSRQENIPLPVTHMISASVAEIVRGLQNNIRLEIMTMLVKRCAGSMPCSSSHRSCETANPSRPGVVN
jgi:solute carrier family 25 S-adenosylmethionine transporter 26